MLTKSDKNVLIAKLIAYYYDQYETAERISRQYHDDSHHQCWNDLAEALRMINVLMNIA